MIVASGPKSHVQCLLPASLTPVWSYMRRTGHKEGRPGFHDWLGCSANGELKPFLETLKRNTKELTGTEVSDLWLPMTVSVMSTCESEAFQTSVIFRWVYLTNRFKSKVHRQRTRVSHSYFPTPHLSHWQSELFTGIPKSHGAPFLWRETHWVYLCIRDSGQPSFTPRRMNTGNTQETSAHSSPLPRSPHLSSALLFFPDL